MNNPERNNWLTITEPYNEINSDNVWEPGFDVDRQVVFSKFGPFNNVFLRPNNFVKRFYHTIYPLSIEEWQCFEKTKLYDDFCTVDITLGIRFQATYDYALDNLELISELNEHIKKAYQGQLIDIANRELFNLSDGSWVKEGLGTVEKKICSSVRETLILQGIQSQVICILKPRFDGFPDSQFGKENVYLHVLKKSYEVSEQQKEELFRQQQEKEKQKIKHKQLELDQFNQVAAMDRRKFTQQAENNRRLLKEKEQQQLEDFEINKRIHEKKVNHDITLKEMALSAELEEKKRYHSKLRENEEQEKIDLINHQSNLKEKELEAKIADYEKQQSSWREARNKIHSEDLILKQQQQQLEFDTETESKKRYDIQRLAMQEESYGLRKNSDVYLKREIELLELEKKRLALQLSIKNYKQVNKERARNNLNI